MMQSSTLENKFKLKLYEKYEKCQKYLIPKEEYYKTIDQIKMATQQASSKSQHHYYIIKKFEVLVCGDVEKLIKKRSSQVESPLYYATIEETYDIISRAHVATGHGGRDRMMKYLKQKYANITTEAVELYKSYCKVCQEKKKRPRTTGVVVKPILTHEFNSRAQVDLIDMQSSPQGQFKWIMVYQCHLTKFIILRPLSSKRASEVAFQLLDIFLLIGAPCILQSDNGSEFTAGVISELKCLWPQLVMVHGKPRHPQSQGSVERANADIKNILTAWLTDNNTNDWTVGLKFVQQQKNCAHHAGINRTPYNAMFGENPKVGLTSSSLPPEILQRLQTEDDLLALHQPNIQQISENSSRSLSQPDTSEDVTIVLSATDITRPLVADVPQVTNLDSDTNQHPEELSPNSENEQLSIDNSDYPEQPMEAEEFTTDSALHPISLNKRLQDISEERQAASESQKKQAERMVKRARLEQTVGEIGDNVAIPVPVVDRGRSDPRNILGIIVDRDENDFYRVAVKAGILAGKYSRNQFTLCPQKLLLDCDVSKENVISLRQALKQTASGGQGFFRCDCAKSKKQCQTNRCKCFKASRVCNSRCHNSSTCHNKIMP